MTLGATTVFGNARLADGRLVDLLVEDGVVTRHRSPTPDADVDLGGRLVVPSLAEPHAHLDKALTAELVANPAGDLMGAIEAWSAHYDERTVPEVIARADRAVALMLRNGTTHIRTHVDVGAAIGQRALDALVQVRDRWAAVVDIQIVALLMFPLTGSEGGPNRTALSQAIEAGADLIGGCPHLDSDPEGMIEVVLDASMESGLPLDLHVDETLEPSMLSLATLARRVVERGHPHAVSASHCVSLSVQPPEAQQRVASLVAEAGISVVALPQTNLFLQARGQTTAPPRAITPIDVLREAGVRVAVGGDNLQDPFNPMGRGDPLEAASLAVTAAHQHPAVAFEQVTADTRALMGLASAGPEVGQRADLLVVDASSVTSMVAAAPGSRTVVRGGRVVVSEGRLSDA